MTKKNIKSLFWAVPLLILLCFLLTGCGCKHEWQAASCTAPKTCSLCQTTDGEALGHTWVDATCDSPKTCTGCKITEGEALGHSWVDATCTAPKTCSVCQKTEGDKLDHTLAEATVTKEATCTEKGILTTVCTVCNQTQSTEEIPINNNHTYTSTVTKAATCVQSGIKNLTCTTCNHQTTQSIPATGHKFTGANCSNAGICSVCNATGAKGDHSFVVTYDEGQMHIADTFAAKRIQKCSHCGVEKTEYSCRGNTYDLDAITAELIAYAKSLGFNVVDKDGLGEWKTSKGHTFAMTDMNLVDQGSAWIIKCEKSLIKKLYDDYQLITYNNPSNIYINMTYTQNGALGGGWFNAIIITTF